MSKYIKKTEAKNVVLEAFNDHIEYIGGKDYQRIIRAIFEAIEYAPGYDLFDAEMERKP